MKTRLAVTALILLALCVPASPQAVFPTAASTYGANLGYASDLAQTTLTAAINTTVLSLPVVSSSLFHAYNIVTIDTEQMMLCGVSSTLLTVCANGRGWGGTTPAPHSSGASLGVYVGAIYWNTLTPEVIALEQNFFNPPTGLLAITHGNGALRAATHQDVFIPFAGCAGMDYPGYDGLCHAPTEVIPGAGCDPTGHTDSTSCLQAWIGSAPAAGSRLFLPAGTYKLCALLLESASNVEIYGSGMGASVIQAGAGCQIPYTGPKDSEMLDVNGANVYVHDITFDVNNQGTNLSMATGIPTWSNSGSYWASGLLKNIGGGGNDTVLYSPGSGSSVCTTGNPCNVYKALLNPVPPGTVPTNDGVNYQVIQSGITTIGNGIAVGVRNTGTKLMRVEIKNGNLGVYLYPPNAGDFEIESSRIHDMGNNMPYWGNNVTMYAIGGIANNVKEHDNTFESIYAYPLGPGATVSTCIGSSSFVFSNNNVTNVINNGGGSATGGCGQTGSSWTITGNNIKRTIPGINKDLTSGIETECFSCVVTGNTISGFDSGIGTSGLTPTKAQFDAITGNTISGTGCTIMDSSLITTYCYGIYLFGSLSFPGDASNDTIVSGNTIGNTYYGVIDLPGNAGNLIGVNNYNGVSVNVVEPNQGAVYVPPLESTSINVDTTLNVFSTGTTYYSTKVQPMLVNGTNGAGLMAGTVFKVHALVFVQNNTGTPYPLTPQMFMGHASGTVTNFAPTAAITVPVSVTLGWLVIDAECSVNNVAAMGSVVCSGTGNFANGSSTTYLPVVWGGGAALATNAWTAADNFGLSFTTSTNNTSLTAQVYSVRYEVIFPKTTI